ncbi:MAG: PepSY domain-containing protein [Bacteroidota bacterium]
MKKHTSFQHNFFFRAMVSFPIWVFLLLFISCGPKISKQSALDIAKSYMAQDSVLSINFEERTEQIINEEGVWHVSFPLKPETNKRGGEPHLFIDQKTGEVIETYFTR